MRYMFNTSHLLLLPIIIFSTSRYAGLSKTQLRVNDATVLCEAF